jgi:hypothetical protein
MIDGPCARCPQATPKAGINPSIFCTILAGIRSYPHAYSLDFINDRDAVVHRLGPGFGRLRHVGLDRQLTKRSDSRPLPSPTLGRPLVSPGMGWLHGAGRSALVRGCEISELDGGLFEPSAPPRDLCWTKPRTCSGHVWVPHMSIFQQRLSVVSDTITNLNIRIRELEQLRNQVKKAQLSARRSRPKSRRKRAR